MSHVNLKFSLADTVNAVQLNVQRYRARQMTNASSMGRIIIFKHFDWTLFLDHIVKDLLLDGQTTTSIATLDSSVAYLQSLGMDSVFAHEQMRLATDGLISQIATNIPSLAFKDLPLCELSLVMPCDLYMVIPVEILNTRGT